MHHTGAKRTDPHGDGMFEALAVAHRNTGMMVPFSCSNTVSFLCSRLLVFVQPAYRNNNGKKSQPTVSFPMTGTMFILVSYFHPHT